MNSVPANRRIDIGEAETGAAKGADTGFRGARLRPMKRRGLAPIPFGRWDQGGSIAQARAMRTADSDSFVMCGPHSSRHPSPAQWLTTRGNDIGPLWIFSPDALRDATVHVERRFRFQLSDCRGAGWRSHTSSLRSLGWRVNEFCRRSPTSRRVRLPIFRQARRFSLRCAVGGRRQMYKNVTKNSVIVDNENGDRRNR